MQYFKKAGLFQNYWLKENLFPVKDFPIYVNTDVPLSTPEPHTHDFLEMVVVSRGYGVNQLSGEVSCGVMQGDVFAIRPGEQHAYANTRNMFIYNVLFDPTFLNPEWQELLKLSNIKTIVESPLYKFHLSLFARTAVESQLRKIIGEISMQPQTFKIRVRSLLLEFLVLIGRAQIRDKRTVDYRQEAVHRAIVFMENHLADKITLGDISHHAHLNKNYFNEYFHLETGTSPWDYLLQLRIEKVKKMLRDTDLPIIEVANQSGFCDQSYMSRAFKKFENITPRQFRSAFYKINAF